MGWHRLLLWAALAAASSPLFAATIDVDEPGVLDTPGATYRLSRDISADMTAFTIGADNITLDLNGHVLTYGGRSYAKIPNSGFEAGGSKPDSWNLGSAPGATRVARTTYYGSWELKVDLAAGASQSIRSATIELPAGKTFEAYALAKGASGNTARLKVVNAANGSVVGQADSTAIHRGFGIEVTFKPSAATDVYLVLELGAGSGPRGTMYVDEVDVRPARDYGVACYRYQNTGTFPDTPSGYPKNCNTFTITDSVGSGRIVQGVGDGVRSAAIYGSGNITIRNVEARATGINTPVVEIANATAISIDGAELTSTSKTVFNRMSPTGILKIDRGGGPTVIRNSTLTGGAQMGISLYRRDGEQDAAKQTLIENNTIKHEEKVTEGYGIAINGVVNFVIRNNRIQPVKGRGILLDNSGTDAANVNGEIVGNTIDVYEQRTPEYEPDQLMAVGIRLRSFNETDANRGIVIRDNTITAHTDGNGVGEAYALAFNSESPTDDIRIENNRLKAWTSDPSRPVAALGALSKAPTGKIAIVGNTFESNRHCIRFGNHDAWNSTGIWFESNTFKKSGEAGGGTFKTILYGFSDGIAKDHELVDGVYLDGTDHDDVQFSGSGEKSLILCWFLDVVVKDGSGRPIQGATVTFTDTNGDVKTERTGSDGKARGCLPEYVRSGSSGTSYDRKNPYRVRVSYAGGSQEKTVTVERTQTLTFTFGSGGGDDNTPPGNVKGLRRGDA
ncbi:MAG: right-handed parallel beta-helix repeat-containing protein [Acidobacteria bacterium]|nr:right-handed parallel beta-helix repeat-containing protein [Acidobacteriota bacterium]